MSKNILQLYGMRPVQPYSVRKLLAEPEIGTDPVLVYGVELEIEGLHPERNSHVVLGMTYHEDGSLRNNGGEFVTHPCKMRELNHVLTTFFMKNKFTDENYSERCSVHVHANVQDFTYDNIMSLCLLYQVFERVLFSYIGSGRDKNIFCVPWYDTMMVSSLDQDAIENFCAAARSWQKYTALNLLPMQKQGTVEFRHMAGTHDVKRILEWCNIIGCLTSYARKTPLSVLQQEIISLNTSSRYAVFIAEVFGQYSEVLKANTQFDAAMEEGVIQCKCSLMNILTKKKPQQKDKEIDVRHPFAARDMANMMQAQAAWADFAQRRQPPMPRPMPRPGAIRPIVNPVVFIDELPAERNV